MGNLFLLYLRASLWGSIFTVVVYMINRLFKQKMPPSWHYYIWIPVVFCFLLPVTIQVPAPAFIVEQNEISSSQNTFEEQTAPIPLPDITETAKPNTAVRQPQPVFQNTPEAESRPNSTIPPSAVAAFIWAVVATGLLCKLFFTYYAHQRKIKRNCIPATGPILDQFNDLCRKKCIGSKITLAIGPNISSPFTTGIISPGIILPDRPYTGNQLEMILQHELVHVKRHDVFIKLLAEIVRAFHWFNPLAHFSAKQIDFQCETACDAAVLYNSTQDERILYGLTILECASQAMNKNTPLALSLGQNKQFLKNRINHIVKWAASKKKYPFGSVVNNLCINILGLFRIKNCRQAITAGK